MTYAMACIGTSSGGVAALQKIFSGLPKDFRLPLIIAQHLPHDSKFDLDLVFGRFLRGRIFEARDKMPIEPACVYVAPPDYHLLIERDLTLSLSQDEPVHFARPSIDVLFESAADALGSRGIGVLLTGANADGADGLARIKEAGGITIAQNPATAESSMMPQAAINLRRPDFILPLKEITETLASLSRGSVAS